MNAQDTRIDVTVLQDMREMCARMVEHHGEADQKERVNAALATAGLPPAHSDFALRWDRKQGAKYREYMAQLDALIALHGEAASEQAA